MTTTAVAKGFAKQVMDETPRGERLTVCLQCGTCGGSCPNGAEMEYTPRTLFGWIQAGEREKVLSANTMWQCVSCYFCTTRCPQEIPITDLLYTLKRMAIREGHASNPDAVALAKTFTGYVDRYGRAFEAGLATRYHLVHRPVAAMRLTGIGLSMIQRGRIALRPKKIRERDQLQSIIRKARELGGVS